MRRDRQRLAANSDAHTLLVYIEQTPHFFGEAQTPRSRLGPAYLALCLHPSEKKKLAKKFVRFVLRVSVNVFGEER